MKALDYVIIEADSQYNNEVLLKNGTSIIINTKIESVSNLNRIAKVVSVPKGIVLQEGDDILFHHNILRKINDHKGKVQQSDFYIKDNYFFVPLDMIFMYKRGDEDWSALSPYCFIKPIKEELPVSKTGLIIPEKVKVGHKGMKKNRGIVAYDNPDLNNMCVFKGDEVLFKDHREYEFEINEEIYYKMDNNSILGTVVKEAV